jgi:uncharacterized membrane protein
MKTKTPSPQVLIAIGLGSAVSVVGFYVFLGWLTYNYRVPLNIFFVIQFVPIVLLLVSVISLLTGVGRWSRRATVPTVISTGIGLLLIALLLALFSSGPNIHGPFAVTILFFPMAILIGAVSVIAGGARLARQKRKPPAQEQ